MEREYLLIFPLICDLGTKTRSVLWDEAAGVISRGWGEACTKQAGWSQGLEQNCFHTSQRKVTMSPQASAKQQELIKWNKLRLRSHKIAFDSSSSSVQCYDSWQNFICLCHGYLRDRKRNCHNSQYTGEPHLQQHLKFQPLMFTKETRNVQRNRIERRFNLSFTLRIGRWKGKFVSAVIIWALK